MAKYEQAGGESATLLLIHYPTQQLARHMLECRLPAVFISVPWPDRFLQTRWTHGRPGPGFKLARTRHDIA